jgi:hypothetical protein
LYVLLRIAVSAKSCDVQTMSQYPSLNSGHSESIAPVPTIVLVAAVTLSY